MDKKEITLAADKPSEEKVIFHNGMTGSVQLELTVPEIPGFTVKLEQIDRESGGRRPGGVSLRAGRSAAARRDPINVQLTVQPLNQVFAIRVKLCAPAPLK